MNKPVPENTEENRNTAADTDATPVSSLDQLLRPFVANLLELSQQATNQRTPEQQRQYLARVQAAGQRLLHRLDTLKDLARLEQGTLSLQPRNFQLPSLLHELAREVESGLAERPVRFRLHLDSRLPVLLHGDPERIRQLIRCFTDNATRFTQEGEIFLQVRMAARNRSSIRLHCTIEDSGPGLPPALSLNPFIPSEGQSNMPDTRPPVPGTGLRMARLLARLMNGDVGILTPHAPGSAFWFSLQLAPAQYPETGSSTEPQPPASRQEESSPKTQVQPVLHLKPGLDPDVRHMLDQLYSALLQEDFNSLQLFRRHRESLKRLLGADALRLSCALEDFDFRRARAILEATCSRKH